MLLQARASVYAGSCASSALQGVWNAIQAVDDANPQLQQRRYHYAFGPYTVKLKDWNQL